ncbi:quinoprotein relay system zinc metallohydrolase 2 [Roseibium litorale]|uniref:Quinoprotein relay system zinc metallohydrolase 2 n=1 Tax=Roseibium litorale TaxID=2803841 RepID=A0ABR9CJL0_9HYPH|nr:quinoprotein relay system zinc metallohydrolase 2 [Roseibium litorale]MBD8891036.1 quinoprotein relay system zinc metallohydrolase 2 [Roseibium litorale]
MFEIVVMLCLASMPANGPSAPAKAEEPVCRQVLLPGHEALDLKACETAARALELPSIWPEGIFAEGRQEVRGEPVCAPLGKALDVTEISPGVFVHEGAIAEPGPGNAGDVSNSGFVIGKSSVAVIDSGGSRQAGEQLYRALRQHTDLPVSHLILTHMHPDHVLGASVFREAGARVVGHPGLARAFEDRAGSYLASFGRLTGDPAFIGTRVILPDEAALDSLPDIDLGGMKLQLKAWPLAHSPTDLTVLESASGTLFTGDLLFDRHAPALDGSLKGWLQALDELAGEPVSVLVPGHGGPVLRSPGGIEPLHRYLDVLASDTRKAIAAGEPLSTAAQHIGGSEAPNWALFDLYNPRNATAAYSELEWE